MVSNRTNNLDIMYLAQNMASKEILVNEGFLRIDSLMNNGAISRAIATPPYNPSESDLYIIPASATGDWANHDNKFTYYHPSKGWEIIVPNEGMSLWVNDEDKLYIYDGTTWIAAVNIESIDKLGINATADATNKLAVKSDAILFDHNGNNSQVKVNKNAASDTASHLFQTGYSGRAEFGLTGDDDFHIKVSPDGSTFHEAAIIDKDNGNIHIEQGLSFNNGTDIFNEYEEGSWTPVIEGKTTVGANSYSVQSGHYTRVGNRVIADFFITLDASAGALDSTGHLRIAGLPFTPYGSSRFSNIVYAVGISLASSGQIITVSSSTSSFVYLYHATTTGNATFYDSEGSDSMSLRGIINYRTNI